ncbi:MAG TPA: Ig-like domain-containing protein, partial [Chthoniobacteraceae bacterium]|nr:Ig-like domain-containing protein [Chthoniobacteraceae bacterium]
KGTPSSIVVRWRTNLATDGTVRFGTAPDALTEIVTAPGATSEHEVTLTGLTADSQYFYSVGTSTSVLATGSEFTFFTAPPVGIAHNTRIWVLGDSGTKDSVAASVRNGYTTFGGGRYTDVWLMLGDNAYNSGTDTEFQAAVFDMYPSYLRQSVLWSAVGNHETNQLTNPDISTVPYFKIFTFPTSGEAGGVASGTEKYYAFDYGRIHFICLDSMTSSRQPGSPMLTWLQADLESTTQDWIIAFWHHPPYSKGSHNSDNDRELIEMRQNVLPLLEAGGVDLVLAGHSHCYERSYFINGHYGLSGTFSSQNLIETGSGREDQNGGVYDKPADLAANQGAVYITAGNGGHVTSWVGGSTAEFNPNPHPAMFYSALHVGSLVIDVEGNRLDAKMIRSNGAVDDYFSIVKSVANTAPSVTITNPGEGASFMAPASITITADAADSDGTIAQVDFYSGQTVIGSATVAPYTINWNNVPAGSYALTATATDNLGATVTSAPVHVTVTAGIPAPPASLEAASGDSQVVLNWNASAGATSYSVKRAQTSGGPYGTIATGVSATTFTDVTVSNGTTYFYVVSASNVSGESANSNEANATPTAPPMIPAAPSALTATAISPTQINLTWHDNASNEAGFMIERSINGAPFAQIATTGANITTFADNGLSRNKKYNYRLRAFNAGGESAFSNTASAKTPK